ncbi:MAG: lysoplasmalogenase [Lachnospiraceae bacterium]|nr:lysoplasmalogenase [Lachnospiraceae bacterium]
MNNIVTVISLILLLIVSIIHLYGTYKCNRRIRKMTKWLLLPLMMVAYTFAVSHPNYYILAAFFFSWAGDVFLLGRGPQFFVLGGIAFLFSHVCFIAAYCTNIDFKAVPYATIAPLLILFIAIVYMVRGNLKDYVPKMLKIPMVAYLMANATMNTFAIMQMFSKPCAATITVSLGALLFLYSDVLLFGVRFHKSDSVYKRHFLEMFAYILGEFLICYGFMQM